MAYLFTSESVSEGHPDKLADQISDAILDEMLRHDPESKVACETMVTTGLVVCSGEVRTKGYVDVQKIVRKTIKQIGYQSADYHFDYKSCGVLSCIHDQSADINQGVVRQKEEDQGAGDQGMMFGYAVKEMDNFMPMPIELSHLFLQELAAIRKAGKQMKYLRPDSKAQITLEYDDEDNPQRVDTIVFSTQHDEFGEEKEMLAKIEEDFRTIVMPHVKKHLPPAVKSLFTHDYKLFVNPTGKFIIGGPHGDTGLTGRKIIVDTYGGKGAHGGGAFSGKDASKVDRSAAYAARHIAKNMVAADIAREVLIQISYAIGIAEPVGIFVNTYNTAKVKDTKGNVLSDGEIAKIISRVFDLRPFAIIKRFGLKNPIYLPTAAYGHFGREHFSKETEVYYEDENTVKKMVDGEEKIFKKVDFFAWEKLDYIKEIKAAFKI